MAWIEITYQAVGRLHRCYGPVGVGFVKMAVLILQPDFSVEFCGSELGGRAGMTGVAIPDTARPPTDHLGLCGPLKISRWPSGQQPREIGDRVDDMVRGAGGMLDIGGPERARADQHPGDPLPLRREDVVFDVVTDHDRLRGVGPQRTQRP